MNLNVQHRRYSMPVRPRHRETLHSFSNRVLAANGETEKHKEHLIRLASNSTRTFDRHAAWLDILRTKTGRPQLELMDALRTRTIHAGNEVCGNCHDGISLRTMCELCAHGASVTQRPHFDTIVCVHHRRWVGLYPGTQQTVEQEHLDAALQLDRLRRKGRVDARLYLYLVDLLGAPLSEYATKGEREKAVFVDVVALARQLTERSFLSQLFRHRTRYEPAWELLNTTLVSVLGREDRRVTRMLWLYLRPSFAALRWAWLTHSAYVPFFSHDFIVPAHVAAAYLAEAAADPIAPRVLQVRPFSEYLAVSRDSVDSVNVSGSENTRILESQVTGRIKVPFLCEEGHHTVRELMAGWTQTLRRVPECPVCSGRTVVSGVNDLQTFHPEVAAQLDPVLSRRTARQVSRASSLELGWRCRAGHRYWATVNNRVNNKTGCPYCFGRVLPGVNDLSTTHPHVAEELCDVRKSALTVTANSEDKLKWRCPAGHDYEIRVVVRSRLDRCPTCTHEDVVVGENLTVTHPDIAKQWHPWLNGRRRPETYTHGSGAIVWWMCEHSHDYQMRVERKTAGAGCPTCAGRKLVPGVNDLASREPVMVLEYHPYLNGPPEPHEVFPSDTKFVWRCLAAGHVTRQTVQHRNLSHGCTDCEPEDRILNKRRAA